MNTLSQAASFKDPKDYVTPHAFMVAPSLYGTPLASPVRRGMALLVDLLLVALLTYVNSMFLAAMVSIVFFRAGHRLKKKQRFAWLRALLRLFAALCLFVVALAVFEAITEGVADDPPVEQSTKSTVLQGMEAISVAALTAEHVAAIGDTREDINAGRCAEANVCWQTLMTDAYNDIDALDIDDDAKQTLFTTLFELTSEQLDEAQKVTMRESLQTMSFTTESEEQIAEPVTEKAVVAAPESVDNDADPYSIMGWLQGIASDLGIGFGWAAVYFSVFCAWLKGQTPGKKLFGIRVLKIDGNSMNLWESFERYGGYGAGLATGLLGFLQIFWDRNRQAIHDKISETLVIDLRKNKVSLESITDGQSSQKAA